MSADEDAKLARIREEYVRDEAEMPPAVTLGDVPAFYECITPPWLTEVVRRRHPEATVTGFRLGDRDSGTTNRRRIYLEYGPRDQGKQYPASLFCKAAQDLPNRITMSAGSGEGEVAFYNNIRAELPIEAPFAHFAAVAKPSHRAIIVLDDMAADVEFGTAWTPMSRARAESQIELLARLHGRFYGDKLAELEQLAAVEPFRDRFTRLDVHHGMEDACGRGLLAAEAVTPNSVLARHAEVWPLTLRAVADGLQGPQTLTHGDVHLGNWYVRGASQMGLTDFQNVTTGHWARDLAYTISTALEVEDRRAWERDLLRLYLELLAQHGGAVESFDDSWRRYRQQMLSVLAYWTVTLTPSPSMAQDMQTPETTLRFLGRITQAIEDLESLDAF